MKKKKIALALVVALALIGLVTAAGLMVQPGGLLIQNVPPGLDYGIYENKGIQLEIFNNDDREHTYTITSKKPSEIGLSVSSEYPEIPYTSWFYYSNNEVTIPANSSSAVRMFVSIPNDDKYLGKKWEVIIAVEGKATGGQTFSLAAFPKVQIETKKPENSLRFRILDRNGNPVKVAGIQLGTAKYNTDNEGILELKNFDIGDYTVGIEKEGYSTVTKEIVVRNTENIYEIALDKKPEKSSNLWLYIGILGVILVVVMVIWLSKRRR